MFANRIATLAAAACLSVMSTASWAEPVTIRYSNWLPANFFLWDDVVRPWLTDIEKATAGRVKVEVTPKVVGTAATQYDVVRDGLADMSWMVTGFNAGRFPLIEFGELPLLGRYAADLGPNMDKIYRKHLADKGIFKGIEPIAVFIITPLQMVTKGKKVNSVNELSGMKFRSSSATLTEVLKLLNVVPILKSPTEAYEMLSTGVINGQVTNLNTIPGFNQLDLMDGVYFVPGGLANVVILMGMNSATWDKISPEDQKAIRAISGAEFARRAGIAYDAADAKALETMRAAKYHMGEATPDQVDQIRNMLKPLEAAWIEKAKAAGLPNAAEILDELRTNVAADAAKR